MANDWEWSEEGLPVDEPGLGIGDVKLALEKVFQGVRVGSPPAMKGSFHAVVLFYEYEVRVILFGERTADRRMHYRFMQRVEQPGERKPTKRMILEVETTDPEELLQAIEDTKAHLLGVVAAITRALQPPTVRRTTSVDDIFRG